MRRNCKFYEKFLMILLHTLDKEASVCLPLLQIVTWERNFLTKHGNILPDRWKKVVNQIHCHSYKLSFSNTLLVLSTQSTTALGTYFCLFGSTVLATCAYVSMAHTHIHIDLQAWNEYGMMKIDSMSKLSSCCCQLLWWRFFLKAFVWKTTALIHFLSFQ